MSIYSHIRPYIVIYSHMRDYMCLYMTISALKYIFRTPGPVFWASGLVWWVSGLVFGCLRYKYIKFRFIWNLHCWPVSGSPALCVCVAAACGASATSEKNTLWFWEHASCGPSRQRVPKGWERSPATKPKMTLKSFHCGSDHTEGKGLCV